MIDRKMLILNEAYRHVFLVQNRNYWMACPFEYDKEKDLVLSFDFAVVNMVRAAGGEAQYIDHIVSSEIMEEYNYKVYEFFAAWHYNTFKQDIFSYRGIDVGSAFRVEVWNDITFYVRIFASLHELSRKIKYETIYAGVESPIVTDIIKFLGMPAIKWTDDKGRNAVEYYFPIFRWMDEALHPTNIRRKLKVFVLKILDKGFSFIDRVMGDTKALKHIYIESYHPTNDIILELRKSSNVRMVRSDFNSIKDIFNGVHLPVFVSESKSHDSAAKAVLERFDVEKHARLSLDDLDISDELYKIIIKRVSPLIAGSFKIVDVIIDFFAKRRLSLMVTISSIGIVNRLMINYCKKNNIPIYVIINGLLASAFLDEAKDGTWINSYGDSIRKNYFKGMDNIVCLGDPRMDRFSALSSAKRINYSKPVIGIGASGFSNIDLNCYLAIEFEFLNDIMKAFRTLREKGREMDLILKVRPNGYIEQYRRFLSEYYPDINIRLFDSMQMGDIYAQSDFVISIYSQVLFEAACFGLPVLYYKNDTQFFYPPFDGRSELVTAFDLEDLVRKVDGFYEHDPIYESFKERKVLEKYIGPLDGKNLKRNIDFIYSLISEGEREKQCH